MSSQSTTHLLPLDRTSQANLNYKVQKLANPIADTDGGHQNGLGHIHQEPCSIQYPAKMFFHFTDTRNLTLIRRHGLYSSLMLNQKGLKVPQAGGNELSLQLDKECGMDRYVHLCFRANHSMEHMAKNDGRIQESVFLHIDPSVIKLKGVLITDDVSNQKNVVPTPASSALDKLDLEIIYKRTEWSRPEFLNRLKIAERYEILIPDHIPTKYIIKGI